MTAPAASGVGYRRVLLRIGPLRMPVRARSIVVGLAAVAALCVLGVLALGLGTYPLTPPEVIRALTGGGGAMDRTVVLDWRLPRALAAITVGILLGIAGALFQTVTRNPLASPDVLGLSNGAFTGMLLALVFVSSSGSALIAGSLLGGFVTAALIWLLSARGGMQGFRLIVVGIGVSAMLASLNTWMLLQIELETAMFASAWGTGSLNGVTAGPLLGALLCALPFVVAAIMLVPRLRQLELGDDMAASTGVRPSAIRAASLLIGVVLVAAATTVAGPVAFVALAAPQVARLIARTPHLSLVLSGLFGGVLLLGADLIAQHVLPTALPVGVVTVSVGGAYLVLMIIWEIRRRV
ncbi:iron chelate uptake ABC transporter family permease subunit [Microbacterium sp. cx-55]|uniref:FecCD family ABC transporter permease n=1 Tax=Microbacterium sp. cx-55 TaxID=2875948 RepID=UPI001CBBA903|nr:iron chelate uptake ABC transporter family permease subunit [Microbacterium sp. cx-55]MBZ4486702.1 iron chelate uptake ABC transporter family permease subunit [Microbacterium sp. cx-55]UGB36338.1 iron chelate uptake ABC transporter family permease subunit [Microbacterium sp. cx-55]